MQTVETDYTIYEVESDGDEKVILRQEISGALSGKVYSILTQAEATALGKALLSV